jgi:anti-sigma factor RsiW
MTDDLQALWKQSGDDPPPEAVCASVERQVQLRRRLRTLLVGVQLTGVVAALWVDMSGVLPTKGVLSIACIGSLAWYFFAVARSDRREATLGALTPAQVLERSIALASKNRRTGLWLAAFPLLVTAGILAGWLLDGLPDPATTLARLRLAVIAVAAAPIAAVSAIGVYTFLSASRERKVLIGRRHDIERTL